VPDGARGERPADPLPAASVFSAQSERLILTGTKTGTISPTMSSSEPYMTVNPKISSAIGKRRRHLFLALCFIFSFFFTVWSAPNLQHSITQPDDFYILALGKLFYLGQMPVRDTFSIFGPAFSLIYGYALSLSDSPIMIVLVGALGYALSLTLLALILSRQKASITLILTMLLLAISLLPLVRMFRWFQWLLPLLMALEIQAYGAAPGHKRYWNFLLTLTVFAASLLRLDLGAVLLVGAMAGMGSIARKHGASGLRALRPLVCNLGLSWATWLYALWLSHADISRYLRLLFSSVFIQAQANHWPLLAFGPGPLVYLGALGLFYLTCLAIHLRAERGHDPMLLTSALMGLLMLPSALYQANFNHVLFVISPALLCAATLMAKLPTPGGKANRAAYIALVLCFASLAWLARDATFCVGPLAWNPTEKLRQFASPPEPGSMLAQRVAAIQAAVPPQAGYFVLTTGFVQAPEVFYANRRVANLDVAISPRLQPSQYQLDCQLNAIRKNHPQVMMVSQEALKPSGLFDSLFGHQGYQQRLYADKNYVIIKRD
jgi:hypothetical protein